MLYRLWKCFRRPLSAEVRRPRFRPAPELLERRDLLSFVLPPEDLQVHRSIYALTSGDINGDGQPDVITTTGGSANEASVFLAEGTAFRLSGRIPTGPWPLSILVGDFTGDGHADLVVGRVANGILLPGQGDGTFDEPQIVWSGRDSSPKHAADFDGDGNLDLLLTAMDPWRLVVLLGHGDGTFRDPLAHPSGREVHDLVVGDFNGDALLDVAYVYDNGSSLITLLGKGDGSFVDAGALDLGYIYTSLAQGDVNGDGLLDLVVGGYSPLENRSSFVALLGTGTGEFVFSGQQGIEGQFGGTGRGSALALGDVNQDGWLDAICLAGPHGSKVSIFLNDGQDGWVPDWSRLVGFVLSDVLVADFNVDSFPDLAVMDTDHGSTNTVSVLWNAADWGPGPGGGNAPGPWGFITDLFRSNSADRPFSRLPADSAQPGPAFPAPNGETARPAANPDMLPQEDRPLSGTRRSAAPDVLFAAFSRELPKGF